MGRPTKLTPKIRRAICERIRRGVSYEIAAKSVGVTRSSLWNWRTWGAEGREPYSTLLDDIERARAEFEVEVIEELRSIANENPGAGANATKALTWLLETTRRDRYGSQITVKVAEAKEHLLDVVERVCARLGAQAVLVEILDELERGGPPAEAETRPVH